jgi:REP element-mobilizing transposase RayT
MGDPLAYLITFRTYGTWLHGDPRGSVDDQHNDFGTPVLDPNPSRATAESDNLRHAPIVLTESMRNRTANAIRQLCGERDWTISALNVRSNHVHAVVTAPDSPERVMHAMKSVATRDLRRAGLVDADDRLWSRHGSTRYLWKPQQVLEACRYVAESQGPDLGGEL